MCVTLYIRIILSKSRNFEANYVYPTDGRMWRRYKKRWTTRGSKSSSFADSNSDDMQKVFVLFFCVSSFIARDRYELSPQRSVAVEQFSRRGDFRSVENRKSRRCESKWISTLYKVRRVLSMLRNVGSVTASVSALRNPSQRISRRNIAFAWFLNRNKGSSFILN